MIKGMLIIGLLTSLLSTVGCLQTRSSVREGEQRQVLQTQVSTLQKSTADVNARFAEIEEQIRFLNGRTEVLENRLAVAQNDLQNERRNSAEVLQSQNQRILIFQEALTRMEQEQSALRAELESLKSKQSTQAAKKEPPKANSKNTFETAEDFFDKKEYRQAILEYQKYREKNPKGKNFSTATYKIGFSFHELGLKDEAKSFYEEVIAKFPKSDAAKKSKARLQKIK